MFKTLKPLRVLSPARTLNALEMTSLSVTIQEFPADSTTDGKDNAR